MTIRIYRASEHYWASPDEIGFTFLIKIRWIIRIMGRMKLYADAYKKRNGRAYTKEESDAILHAYFTPAPGDNVLNLNGQLFERSPKGELIALPLPTQPPFGDITHAHG